MSVRSENIKFKVLFAEVATGIVYTIDLKMYYQGEGEMYAYFESYEEALEYGNKIFAARPDLEFIVRDSDENLVIYKSIYEEKIYQ